MDADNEHDHCSRRCAGQFLIAAASIRHEETDTGRDRQHVGKTPEENGARDNPGGGGEEIVSPATYVITIFS
jgi:hypothetical protein